MSIDIVIEKVLNEDSKSNIINFVKDKFNKAHLKYSLHEAGKNEGIMSAFVFGQGGDEITLKLWIAKDKVDPNITGGQLYYDSFYHRISEGFDTEKEMYDYVAKNIDLIVRSINNVIEFRELKKIFDKL